MNPEHIIILDTLNNAGFAAYFVGGLVRDKLLGRKPKDADITTAATPEEVAALFPHTEFVGAKFGITLVKTNSGEAVEVATFRLDGVYADSRHPTSVKFTTDVREDVKRRDLTVCALLMDKEGNILDFVGGLPDLEARVIRTVGDAGQRFQEDALRMLRAIRFACVLGFTIHPDTMTGIQQNVELINQISAERVRDELNRILTSGRAAEGIKLLDESGLLALILPEIITLKGCPQNPVHHPEGDVFVHTLKLLAGLQPGCSVTLALAALLHDVGKPATLQFREDGAPTAFDHENAGAPIAAEIMRRLVYPHDIIDVVINHVKNHMSFRELGKMRKSKQLRFLGQPGVVELLELHRLDSMSGSGDLTGYDFATELLTATPEEVLHPVRLITGRDLIAMGLKPGPMFRQILEEVAVRQLEGAVTTREGALAVAQEMRDGR